MGRGCCKHCLFAEQSNQSTKRYAALIPVVKHLVKLHILDFQPFFLFPVVSALGLLNDHGTKMQKWMHTVLNHSHSTVSRDDGIPFSTVKARIFRRKCRMHSALDFNAAIHSL